MATKLSKQRQKDLNHLIDSKSLTDTEKAKMLKYTDFFARQFQSLNLKGASVDRVFKGGSWKKGTALNEDYDVDLVLFLNWEFQDYANQDSRKNVLLQISNHLRGLGVRILRENHFVVTFEYKGVHFDVLTAYNAAKVNTKAEKSSQREEMMKLLKVVKASYSYSSCFTESSCEFLQRRNAESGEKLVRAIKLAKYWNKTNFMKDTKHETQVPSYAFELLVSHIYDMHKNDVDLSGPGMFCYMLDILANLKRDKPKIIAFGDYTAVPPDLHKGIRFMGIFDPCLQKDVVSTFLIWDKLIQVAKKTLSDIYNNVPNTFAPLRTSTKGSSLTGKSSLGITPMGTPKRGTSLSSENTPSSANSPSPLVEKSTLLLVTLGVALLSVAGAIFLNQVKKKS